MNTKTLQNQIAQMEKVYNDPNTSNAIKESLAPSIKKAKEQLEKLADKKPAPVAAKVKKELKTAVKKVKASKPKKAKTDQEKLTALKKDIAEMKDVYEKPSTSDEVKTTLKTALQKAHEELTALENKVAPVKKVEAPAKTVKSIKGHKKPKASEKLKAALAHKKVKGSLRRDAARKSFSPGKRISADGHVYYEYRSNRSDVKHSSYPYLKKGGKVNEAEEMVAVRKKIGGLYEKYGAEVEKMSDAEVAEKWNENSGVKKGFGTPWTEAEIKAHPHADHRYYLTGLLVEKDLTEDEYKYFGDGGNVESDDYTYFEKLDEPLFSSRKDANVRLAVLRKEDKEKKYLVQKLGIDEWGILYGIKDFFSNKFKEGGAVESDVQLLVDGHHGIYIPKYFVSNFDLKKLGFSDEKIAEYKKDLSDPSNEEYWDAWQELIDEAKDEKGYTLLEDSGDLWLVSPEFEGFDVDEDEDVQEFKKGGVHQAAAQGKNYNWRTDRGETAKHVGWRYTDAGAKRLDVKAGNVPTQAHIEKYEGREFIAGGKKHRYIYKETRKDKSDISPKKRFEGGGQIPAYFGSGKNIEVFGYTTQNFDNCAEAVKEFERAISEIEAMGTEHETMVISMREALVKLAKLVDELFGIEKTIYDTKLPADRGTHTLIALNIMPNIGINNYKSGMHVALTFLTEHIQNICEYQPEVAEVVVEEIVTGEPDPFPIIEKEEEGADELTYDIVFNNNSDSNNLGFKETLEYCIDYVETHIGGDSGYFKDYKGGTVQIVCNENGETVKTFDIPK